MRSGVRGLHGPAPLYAQLKREIRERLRSGAWPAGRALPGERQLVDMFGVSRPTVRQALGDLVAEGLLLRLHGKGTFPADPGPDRSVGQLVGFAEELQLAGLDPEIRVLRAGPSAAPADAAAALGLAPGDAVVMVERLACVDGAPFFCDRVALPETVGRALLGFDLGASSVYVLLEALGMRLGTGDEVIAACRAGDWEAGLLGLDPGSPVLQVRRVTVTEDGRPLETSLACYHPERYRYRVRLRRKGPDD